jgi:DNA-binding MarR family transcriptional regulator
MPGTNLQVEAEMTVGDVWIDETGRRSLRNLSEKLNKFRVVYPEMPVQQMLLLLILGVEVSMPQKELADRLKMSSAAVSRNIATLSTLTTGTSKAGLGLVSWVDHPSDRRSKLVVLTEQGRNLVASLI